MGPIDQKMTALAIILVIFGFLIGIATHDEITRLDFPVVGGGVTLKGSQSPPTSSEQPSILKDIERPIANSSELQVKITDPHEEQTVVNWFTVHGTIYGELPDGNYLWLLVGEQSVNQWRPQGIGGRIMPIKGKWSKEAWLGGDRLYQNIERDQEILVLLVDEKVDKELNGSAETYETLNSTYRQPAITLPSGDVLDIIRVTKGKNGPTASAFRALWEIFT